jgi:hypothetical protein
MHRWRNNPETGTIRMVAIWMFAGSCPDGHLNGLQERNARTAGLFRRKSLGFLELLLTWAAHWLGRSSRKPPFTTHRLRI